MMPDSFIHSFGHSLRYKKHCQDVQIWGEHLKFTNRVVHISISVPDSRPVLLLSPSFVGCMVEDINFAHELETICQMQIHSFV